MADLDLSRHSLNLSQSKQKYSFPKTKRFLNSDKPLCDSLYGLPSTATHRATSLGYGNKTLGTTDNHFIPGVGAYTLAQGANPQDAKRKAISFGVSREKMQLGGPLGTLKFLKEYPSPTAYQPKDVSDYRAPSLRSRHPDHEFEQFAKLPGPGTYQHDSMGARNYYLNSRYKNDTNVKISQVSRLEPLPSKQPRIGPADYNAVDGFNGAGRYNLTKNKGVTSCVFGRSERQGIMQKGTVKFPGPGQYKSFSMFG